MSASNSADLARSMKVMMLKKLLEDKKFGIKKNCALIRKKCTMYKNI
jgi:hypothetical protein